MIRSADIPDYKNIVKRQNPLEAVVQAFANVGFDPNLAFETFDDDGDEVLTSAEIEEGLICNDIKLLDSEKKELFRQIDKNNDGVCTLDEWLGILQPALKAENKFI